MSTTEEETRVLNICAALNEALHQAMSAYENLVVLGEDVADPIGGVFKVTKGLSTSFGTDRVRATPIAEQSIIGAAIGASLAGYRTVAEVMFFDFVTVCLDQLLNHAAKLRYMSGGRTSVPITVRTAVGSNRFGAQHSQTLEAWFMHTPGIKVVTAATPADAKGLLLSCIDDEDPCLFIEQTRMYYTEKGPVPAAAIRVPLGVADVKRPGSDVTLITYGYQLPNALAAAEQLAADGVDCEVVDLRSLIPLDKGTVLQSVGKTKRAVVVHDAVRFCGPGAEVSSLIHEELFGELDSPVVRIGGKYVPPPFSTSLRAFPNSDDIVMRVRAMQ